VRGRCATASAARTAYSRALPDGWLGTGLAIRFSMTRLTGLSLFVSKDHACRALLSGIILLNQAEAAIPWGSTRIPTPLDLKSLDH